MPRCVIARRVHFNAAHRLHNSSRSDEWNRSTFGPCNNPNYHCHNYELDVLVEGEIDPDTGYVLDVSVLRRIVDEAVVAELDHRNLNLDVDFMRNIIPTTENLAVGIWRILVTAIAPAQLVLIRLWESENNRVEYAGE